MLFWVTPFWTPLWGGVWINVPLMLYFFLQVEGNKTTCIISFANCSNEIYAIITQSRSENNLIILFSIVFNSDRGEEPQFIIISNFEVGGVKWSGCPSTLFHYSFFCNYIITASWLSCTIHVFMYIVHEAVNLRSIAGKDINFLLNLCLVLLGKKFTTFTCLKMIIACPK